MTQFAYDAYVPTRQTNGLGIAGFVISLVGLLGSGGLLCPIGLIISLIAVGRQPRGFAIAGIVIGFLGTCGGLIVGLVFGAAILALLGITAAVAVVALNDPERMEVTVDMANISQAVQRAKSSMGYLPASLSELRLDAETLQDPWGSAYVYTFTEEQPGFDIISHGKDGIAGNEDDVAMSKLDEMWNQFFQVQQNKGDQTVRIKMGDRTMTVHGGKDGGRVTINTGEKTLNISGSDSGGQITVTDEVESVPSNPEAPDAPDVPDEPDSPPAPSAPDAR